MKFTNDDFPKSNKGTEAPLILGDSDLADVIDEEHPRQLLTLAEQRILAMHHHEDGTSVELHEVGSREFIAQSMAGSLEGKLAVSNSLEAELQQNNQAQNNLAAAKIEYEKKSSHDLLGKGQSKTEYGAQQSVTGVARHGQDTMMMGCNCGLEWTVTGVSMKRESGNPGEAIKIEQYGSPSGGGAAAYGVSGGNSGGGPGEYRTSGGARQDYKG